MTAIYKFPAFEIVTTQIVKKVISTLKSIVSEYGGVEEIILSGRKQKI